MENKNLESQVKTLQLSPHPDPKHPHRVLLYGLAALLIIGIALCSGYLQGMKNIQSVQQQQSISSISHVTPTQTAPFSTPQAKSLDINIPGVTLQPVKSTNNSTSPIFIEQYDGSKLIPNSYDIGANTTIYSIPITTEYFVTNINIKNSSYSSLLGAEGPVIDYLRNQGFAEAIVISNKKISASAASGVCGDDRGMIGYKDGQLREVEVETFVNPCGTPDGSIHTDSTRQGGIYLSTSDKVSVDKVINVKN